MRACLRAIARVQITDLIQSKLVLTSGVRSAEAAQPRARHVSTSSFCCIALTLPLSPAFLSPHQDVRSFCRMGCDEMGVARVEWLRMARPALPPRLRWRAQGGTCVYAITAAGLGRTEQARTGPKATPGLAPRPDGPTR